MEIKYNYYIDVLSCSTLKHFRVGVRWGEKKLNKCRLAVRVGLYPKNLLFI